MSDTNQQPNFARVAIRGTAWQYGAFFGGKFMVFISTIILARILSKDDFGLVGYAVTTTNFLDVISDFGIGAALVYFAFDKRRASTAFWLNLLIRFSLFVMAWFIAPMAGTYFRDLRVVEVTRILAITFLTDSLGDIHLWMLRKKLAFSRSVIPDFISAISKGLSSILFAVLGFGAWSLIWGQIMGSVASTIVLWIISPWRPTFEFDMAMVGGLLKYGFGIVSVTLLGTLIQNLDYLLVGRYLGAELLGVYILAYRLPDLAILQFARVLSTVLFPLYSKMREVPGSLTRGFYLTTRYVSLVTLPLGVGLALVARPFTLAVFTDKWQEIIPVLQGLSIYAVMLSLAFNAGSAYKAEGRPQVLTWLGLFRLAMLFPALWWAVNSAKTLVAVGWMHALVAFIGGTVNLLAAARLLRLSLRELVEALSPSLLAVTVMAFATLGALHLTSSSSNWIQLTCGVLVGGSIYVAALWYIRRDMVLSLVRNILSSLTRGMNASGTND